MKRNAFFQLVQKDDGVYLKSYPALDGGNPLSMDDIMKYLVEEQGVETLRDQALKLVKEGKTTVDEFNKIIAYID